MGTIAPDQFKRITALAKSRWGLSLTEAKAPLVSNRIAAFLRTSRFTSMEEYLDHVESTADTEELLAFFDLLSTNVTSFFRDRPHFDYLERELYTPLVRGNLTLPGKTLRVWSAACSTGQEPYSLAMHATEHLKGLAGWQVKILGTDLSNYAVQQATAATYEGDKLDGIPPAMRDRCLTKGADGLYRVAADLRALVTIARLNLMDPWPFKNKFNVIFCRNVMIYFDTETRRRLVMRFHDLLTPGGILAIGSAETLAGLDTPFTPAQASVYVKA